MNRRGSAFMCSVTRMQEKWVRCSVTTVTEWLERPQVSFSLLGEGYMIPEMNKMQVDEGKLQFATLNQDATIGPEKQV